MKHFLLLLAFSLSFISCDGIITQKKTSDEFLEEEIKSINWNEVDTYPLFPNCNETETKSNQRLCFESTLHNHVNTYINSQELISNTVIADTLFINLSILKESEFVITKIEGDTLTFSTFPELQGQLYESISTLPTVQPALKRGVPVNTMFVLPLILKTE